jgi:hypothetical protein
MELLMKFKFALKAGCAALALAGSSAFAGPFYLDTGVDFGGVGLANDKVCATCTSVKTEFQFKYDSKTVITDTNGSGTINAGDAISTIGGLVTGGTLSNNLITNFLPAEVFGANSNNGYGQNAPGGFLLSFSATGLNGIVTGVNAGVPTFAYGPGGVIDLYYTTNGTTFINFMDILISDGGATGVSTILHGTVDFTNIDAAATSTMKNLFHTGNGSCSSDSFFDIWSGAGTCGGLDIAFKSTQDANVEVSQFTQVGNTFAVSTNHNGSASFDVNVVPEPGSLALVGLALAGLGFGKRRRASAK